MNAKKAIVVGAGISGISSAIKAAQLGFEVIVFDQNTLLGGKLNELEINGFRFDKGPSLFTMPHLIDEHFIDSGKNPRDYFNYLQLNETCRYFFNDHTRFTAFTNKEELVQSIENTIGNYGHEVLNFLKKSEEIYSITNSVFLEKSLHRWSTYLNKNTLKSLLQLHKIDSLRSMNKANTSFFSHPKLVQLFNRYATYNGSNPYKAPATLNVIPHIEFGIGAYFPLRGMYQIVQSLTQLAKELGVQFIHPAKVSEIIIENKQVKGVIANNTKYLADVVISTMDIVKTYEQLLKNIQAPKKVVQAEKSSSAMIFYWGINKTFPELGLHNILFSENYQEEFHHIFDLKTIYKDPTVYINITSKHHAADAPEGCENWFVMINVPNNSGQDWKSLQEKARNYILQKISHHLGTWVQDSIVAEHCWTPIGIEQDTFSTAGALYGNSSNSKWSAFLRHKNFHSNIRGLYFGGGSVHPGGGIPLAIYSAKIIKDHLKDVYLK